MIARGRPEHPAVEAWRKLQPASAGPESIHVLRERHKARPNCGLLPESSEWKAMAEADGRVPPVPAGSAYLYVHFPFCEVLCPFCSFHRVQHRTEQARHYFAALRFAKVPMIRQFGLLLAVGIAVICLCSIIAPPPRSGSRGAVGGR